MTDINFKYGSLIRTSLKDVDGKWDATLDEDVRNSGTNADLTIHISVYFAQIDPAGRTGLHGDHDDTPTHPSKRKIQRWKPGEFHTFTHNLVRQAQRFWNGRYWLQTPDTYKGLDWPDAKPTHRCNIYCKFELELVTSQKDANYTIAVVRVQDGEKRYFRPDARLYTQKSIDSQQMIPHSTAKFWAHFHEVGHLLGLGHVGHGGHVAGSDGSDQAYGVTQEEMHDVMGRGTVRHKWHAKPWQEGAEAFTGVKAANWKVSTAHIYPKVLPKQR
jgi:hypothetical protein